MSDCSLADNVHRVLDNALDAGEGLLRLSPTWVPRSFLHPGKRIRLRPEDYYAYGAERGGIDERWFASTTDAAQARSAAVPVSMLSRTVPMSPNPSSSPPRCPNGQLNSAAANEAP